MLFKDFLEVIRNLGVELYAINGDRANAVVAVGRSNALTIGTEIDGKDASVHVREFPDQVGVVTYLTGSGAMHPVKLWRTIGASHENLVALRMPNH